MIMICGWISWLDLKIWEVFEKLCKPFFRSHKHKKNATISWKVAKKHKQLMKKLNNLNECIDSR